MGIFKCKMCGGNLEINGNETVATCEYCGTQQTLPKLDDDRRANLYDRANHFRRNNEFDKAMGIYEQILNEDSTDAEAYWSLVLCRYGIEYVEDPSTHKRIPTIHRAQYTSIFDDDNYKSALQYADSSQRSLYEDEARNINEIQKGILAISQKEDPFDIFICYKETDDNGRRTQDSVLANDLYHQLTQEGFKVFYARITLEDKLGTAYEPYIFAALNSAKVMVVLGTKPEYFKAVWVRNEWSRFLSLIKDGEKKILIPAYKDMDPYDLPDEFSHLQAQDMSKLGFMQDLIRGIKKILSVEEPSKVVKETVVSGNANTASLLKRVFIFLEDENWKEADEYSEKVLDIDPECAEAYLGKLMADLQVSEKEDLAYCEESFEHDGNYQKIVRFGKEELQDELKGYIEQIHQRQLNESYDKAVKAMHFASTEGAFKEIAKTLKNFGDFKDANALAEQCLEKAEECRKNAIYSNGKTRMHSGLYEDAIHSFASISGWKDADELINTCKEKIKQNKEKQEAERIEAERQAEQQRIEKERADRKRKKIVIVVVCVCVCIAFWIVLVTVIIPKLKLNKAMSLLDEGEYESAFALLGEIGEAEKAKYEKLLIAQSNIGDMVFFGSYEQDNNTANGKENIEWLVLDKKGNQVLLLSNKALDYQSYNKKLDFHSSLIPSNLGYFTWTDGSLRKWLNGSFITDAFSKEEQTLLQDTNVPVDRNPEDNTKYNNETTDKIFLLGIDEVNKYFGDGKTLKCVPTAYAKAKDDSYMTNDSTPCRWWLRTLGCEDDSATFVRINGAIEFYGELQYVKEYVRPAIWVSIQP